MYQLINRCRQVTIATIFLIILGSGHANAITMPAEPSGALLTTELMSINDPEILRNVAYKDIVDLLNAGQRDQANLKIANILIKQPGDKVALELAGITLLQMKKFKAAEESFRRLVDQPPVRPGVITKYAVVKMINGDIENGSKLLRQLLEFTPENTLALRYLAWAEEQGGNIQAAIKYLRMLPQPEQTGLREDHIALARIYDNIGSYPAIIELLADTFTAPFSQLNTTNAEGAFYLVHAYAATNGLREAKELATALRPLIEAEPTNLFLIDLRLTMGNGETEKAENMVNVFIQEHPESASFARVEFTRSLLQHKELVLAVSQMGLVLDVVEEDEIPGVLGVFIPALLNENMQDSVIKMLKGVATKYPHNHRIAYNLADIQSIAGRKQDALSTLAKLIEHEKPFPSAFLLAGSISRDLGKHENALKTLSRYVELMPTNPQGWISLAGSYFDLNEMEKAQETLKQGVLKNPQLPILAYELGTLYQESGKLELANEQYESVLEQNANFIQAMDNLASNLLDMNQAVEKARDLAEKVYAALPDSPYIQDLWGWALYRTGELDNARAILQVAAKGVTDSGRADYHLALTLRDLGEKPQARKHFKLALEKGLPEALKVGVANMISASR